MGKVIINEHDAAQTASKNSSSKNSPSTQKTQQQISRFGDSAKNVGEKMSTKPNVAKSSKITVNDAEAAEKSSTKAKVKPVAYRSNGKAVFGLPAGEAGTAKSNKKVVTQARIVERTQVRVPSNKTAGAKKTAGALDPELALLANRTSSAEKTRIDVSKSGKSMSGMVGGTPRRQYVNPNRAQNTTPTTKGDEKQTQPKEEDLRFTKFKSILIGVGVAAVVAIVGFVCIGLFSGGKNMCTVLFESNGGSKVDGTEIVCGRTVKRPDNPTKEGFNFEGWTYEGEPFDFDNTPLYKNATLTAKWQADGDTEVVTVSFDTNGGLPMSDVEVAKGKKLGHIGTPTRPGYVFEDWYLGDNLYDFDQPVEEDITLRAEWTKQQIDTNTSVDNSTPAPAKVASMSVSGSLTLEVGKSGAVQLSVVPSSANYNLSVSSSDEAVATCSVNKLSVSCTAKAAGTASIRVRDANSGVSAHFTVTVLSDDVPPVDDNPPVTGPDNPGDNTGGNTGGDSGNEDGDNTGGSGDGDNTGGTGGDNIGSDGDNTSGDNTGGTETTNPDENTNN